MQQGVTAPQCDWKSYANRVVKQNQFLCFMEERENIAITTFANLVLTLLTTEK
jgi:hypothetical protein